MRSRSLIFVVFMMACVFAMSHAQGRTAVIRWGVETASIADPDETLELRWIVHERSDGTLLVATKTGVKGLRMESVFAPGFKPLSYRLETATPSLEGIHCSFADDSLSCDGDSEGKHSHAQLAVGRPYVFETENFSGDFLATIAGLLGQVERTPGKTTVVTCVGLSDSDEFALEIQETEPVVYVGRDVIHLKSGMMNAHKYTSDHSTYWVADSGLLVAMQEHQDGIRVEIIEIKDPDHLLTP